MGTVDIMVIQSRGITFREKREFSFTVLLLELGVMRFPAVEFIHSQSVKQVPVKDP